MKKSKPKTKATGFIVLKSKWHYLAGRSSAQFRTCFPISMDGVGMMWEYCCRRCVDWKFQCCLKCGHNQGCENSPYATRRRVSGPISDGFMKVRGLSV